jgi:plastocyanin
MARWHAKTLVMAAPVMAVGLAIAGCGGGSSASAGSSASPGNSDAAASPGYATTAAGAASAGGATAGGHGTSVAGMTEVTMQMNDDFFSPALLTGTPGQKVMLDLVNDGGVEHNFTLASQKVDQDVEPGESAKVQVTFPSSGVISFICEYHVSRGMKGMLAAS